MIVARAVNCENLETGCTFLMSIQSNNRNWIFTQSHCVRYFILGIFLGIHKGYFRDIFRDIFRKIIGIFFRDT